MPAGSQTLLKRTNQRAILDCILECGPLSRADLSKRLKISKPTVSANVNDLIGMDLLQEIGFSETDVGKRPMLVDFNKNFQYILVIDFISFISRGKVPVAVCNLFCEPQFVETLSLTATFTGDEVRRKVVQTVHDLLEQNHIGSGQIGKVVLTAPTARCNENHLPLECRNGEVINVTEFLKPEFEGKLIVKNDINLAAIGEKHFGVGKDSKNLYFVWAGLAVGGGLILNGELYEGTDGFGGELAYSVVYNPLLKKYVFLKDIASMKGIRKYIEARREAAAQSQIASHLLGNTFYLDMMIEAAANGDTFCQEFAQHVCRIFATAIANAAYTLNLETIIIGGEYTGFGTVLVDEVRRIVETVPHKAPVVTTPLHANAAMYGAFKLGAESVIPNLL